MPTRDVQDCPGCGRPVNVFVNVRCPKCGYELHDMTIAPASDLWKPA